MISVRRNVFETNSSSTHSLTMCSEDEYNKWKNGEMFYDSWNDELITKEEYLKQYEEYKKEYFEDNPNDEEEDFKDYFNDDKQFYTHDEYFDEIEYETYKASYTTKNGEKIIAFGYYGNAY